MARNPISMDEMLNWISTGEPPRLVSAVKRRVTGEPPASPASKAASSPATTDDPVEKIRELARLRDEGLLTEDEFQAKKAELLGQI
jgi:TPP-dependent pyruvate/acetoin dehydrogenase alpha subunit